MYLKDPDMHLLIICHIFTILVQKKPTVILDGWSQEEIHLST